MAAADLLTFEEARRVVREVGSASTTNGSILAAAVTGVSLALARKCGPIMQETVTAERHPGGTDVIHLRRSPITAVTSVTVYDSTAGESLAAAAPGETEGYRAEGYSQTSAPYSGRIVRVGSSFPETVVSYTAGRFSTNNSATNGGVTEDFKAAARITLENWWQQYRDGVQSQGEYDSPGSSFPRFAIPNAAIQLLGDEVHERDDGTDVQVG